MCLFMIQDANNLIFISLRMCSRYIGKVKVIILAENFHPYAHTWHLPFKKNHMHNNLISRAQNYVYLPPDMRQHIQHNS